MSYPILRFVHLLGLVLIGAGLIGVWYADLRSRQARNLPLFAEAVRQIAVFYDGLVVPGRSAPARFWHLADRDNLWRLGVPWDTLARWDGGAVRFRVYRGEYHYQALFPATPSSYHRGP